MPSRADYNRHKDDERRQREDDAMFLSYLLAEGGHTQTAILSHKRGGVLTYIGAGLYRAPDGKVWTQ